MKKTDMLRLLETEGFIEAKFKMGFKIYPVVINVRKNGDEHYLNGLPFIPYVKREFEYQERYMSIVKNNQGVITGLEFWDESPAGYVKLFYPFGKIKFICHYPPQYYKPQTIIGNHE